LSPLLALFAPLLLPLAVEQCCDTAMGGRAAAGGRHAAKQRERPPIALVVLLHGGAVQKHACKNCS
jgi:hypothetical protein